MLFKPERESFPITHNEALSARAQDFLRQQQNDPASQWRTVRFVTDEVLAQKQTIKERTQKITTSCFAVTAAFEVFNPQTSENEDSCMAFGSIRAPFWGKYTINLTKRIDGDWPRNHTGYTLRAENDQKYSLFELTAELPFEEMYAFYSKTEITLFFRVQDKAVLFSWYELPAGFDVSEAKGIIEETLKTFRLITVSD
jgi:hypothetical protein